MSYGLQQLQQKPDMIIAEIRPAKLIEGQQYSDSENELDNPFLMDDDKDGEQLEIYM